jgi:hypothetical protein
MSKKFNVILFFVIIIKIKMKAPLIIEVLRNYIYVMDYLSVYGKIIRKYEGEGQIILDDDQKCNCDVIVAQIANGKILAHCVVHDNKEELIKCFYGNKSIDSIKFMTKQNEEILVGGPILITYSDYSNTIVFANKIISKKIITNKPIKTKFGITNFEYFGNKLRELPNGGSSLDILDINVGDTNFNVYQLEDYKTIIKLIEAQKGIDVTSEIFVNISPSIDMDSIIKKINILCKLLSLARGTKINWIYYDFLDENNNIIYSTHFNNIVWQYVGLPLIDIRNPHDLPKFLQKSIPTYIEKNDKYGLDKVIESYLDAKRETGYLELRALRAVIVMEYLKGKYSNENNLEYIIENNIYKKIIPEIKNVVKKQCKLMAISDNAVKEIEQKISELNRKNFGTLLEYMFKDFHIIISKEELTRFIKIRNSLVHKSSFLTHNYWQEYSFLINIVDRVLLKILEYDGLYLDICNNFNRIQITNS